MNTRLNITIPAEIATKLKKLTPKRGISKFLAEAAEERIKLLERDKALKELLAAPPALTFLKGKNAAVKWVRELRRSDEKRLKRVWKGRV